MYPISRRARALAVASAAGATVAGGAAVALAQPTVTTNHGCYLVGQTVHLSGQGFAPSSTYVVTLDGVYLGQRSANPQGNFAIPLHPGGLPAGAAQHVDHVKVSDGSSTASAIFTLTRPAGAQILTSGGSNAKTLRASFKVWGFALGGSPRPVYVHYIEPTGEQQALVLLGQTGGQCGFITTPGRKLFPYSVTSGTWTLQVDTHRSYSRHPSGPVVPIRITIH